MLLLLLIQSKLLSELEGNPGQAAAWKAALQQQEGIIQQLEKLLGAAVARTKEQEQWRATAEGLQAEVDHLRYV